MSCQRALLICLAWIAPASAGAESIPREVDSALGAPMAEEREAALDRLIETHESRSELIPKPTVLLRDTELGAAADCPAGAVVRGAAGCASRLAEGKRAEADARDPRAGCLDRNRAA